jgi:hypothetical protein
MGGVFPILWPVGKMREFIYEIEVPMKGILFLPDVL